MAKIEKVEIPGPPEHLSEKSKKLWEEIAGKRASSAGRLALLQVGLEALDRADQASKLIAEQGLTIETKRSGVTHLNPLLKVERENRNLFAKIWNDLGLKFDPSRVERFDL